MDQDRKTQVFLIGAMKAGTTSIASMLGEQRKIYLSSVKEPNFFKTRARTLPFTGPVSSVEQWTNFHWTLDDYDRLFAKTMPGQLWLDASTAYLPSAEAPSMIREYNPDARIIVSLRDPVERAYSAYNYMSAGAGDRARTFEEALASELNGERDTWLSPWRYLHVGKYDIHLANWLAEFPAQQILILDFNDLVRDSAGTIGTICRHLDIGFDPSLVRSERENTTAIGGPVNRWARRFLLNPGPWKVAIKPFLPHHIRHGMKQDALKALQKVGKRPEKMKPETRAMLQAYYRPHIERTYDLLLAAFGLAGTANPANGWLASADAWADGRPG
ncbi:sulfotransferase family protein [Devosia ginsengisoli]|uniref:Sulfotransferase domain-containing protein n=1 Tax=Devosia ginsengisoli TaxID=400770 RepID=A0A5B8LST4_9HYPH|nr:sulfotransferase [Devosia ginsengisoli]QDZ10714.1 sulfotransferase domain-containing protein [Devosia ginsengisoli]